MLSILVLGKKIRIGKVGHAQTQSESAKKIEIGA